MKIIGVGGTNGSGKDTVAQMLADQYGFLFVSVSDLLREELRRRNLPIERENLRMVSGQWRREFGLGVLVNRSVEKFKAGNYKGLVVAPMRNVGEAERVHELGGTLIWVDADPKIRYERVRSRQRTAEDDKTFEEFLAEEAAEMHSSGDAATLNMSGVRAISDIFLENDSNDIEAFKKEADKVLQVYV